MISPSPRPSSPTNVAFINCTAVPWLGASPDRLLISCNGAERQDRQASGYQSPQGCSFFTLVVNRKHMPCAERSVQPHKLRTSHARGGLHMPRELAMPAGGARADVTDGSLASTALGAQRSATIPSVSKNVDPAWWCRSLTKTCPTRHEKISHGLQSMA